LRGVRSGDSAAAGQGDAVKRLGPGERLPWASLYRRYVLDLKLEPGGFGRMTLAQLAVLLEDPDAAPAMSAAPRGRFSGLAALQAGKR
jgi:hypothetical protein